MYIEEQPAATFFFLSMKATFYTIIRVVLFVSKYVLVQSREHNTDYRGKCCFVLFERK